MHHLQHSSVSKEDSPCSTLINCDMLCFETKCDTKSLPGELRNSGLFTMAKVEDREQGTLQDANQIPMLVVPRNS